MMSKIKIADLMKSTNPTNHGGPRKGAGRPKTITKPVKTYSFQLFIQDMDKIPGNKTKFVRDAVKAKLIADGILDESF